MSGICMNCDGTGWVEGGETLQTTCHKCGGTGEETTPMTEKKPEHPGWNLVQASPPRTFKRAGSEYHVVEVTNTKIIVEDRFGETLKTKQKIARVWKSVNAAMKAIDKEFPVKKVSDVSKAGWKLTTKGYVRSDGWRVESGNGLDRWKAITPEGVMSGPYYYENAGEAMVAADKKCPLKAQSDWEPVSALDTRWQIHHTRTIYRRADDHEIEVTRIEPNMWRALKGGEPYQSYRSAMRCIDWADKQWPVEQVDPMQALGDAIHDKRGGTPHSITDIFHAFIDQHRSALEMSKTLYQEVLKLQSDVIGMHQDILTRDIGIVRRKMEKKYGVGNSPGLTHDLIDKAETRLLQVIANAVGPSRRAEWITGGPDGMGRGLLGAISPDGGLAQAILALQALPRIREVMEQQEDRGDG